jgi:hypothetical protein
VKHRNASKINDGNDLSCSARVMAVQEMSLWADS